MSCDVDEVMERLENEKSLFSNPSVASPKSQLILQHFFHFSYITGSSLTSPGEPPMMFPQADLNVNHLLLLCY